MSMHLKAHPACRRDLIKNCQPSLQTLLHAEPRHPNGKTNNTTIFLSGAIAQFLTLIWVYSVELLRTFYHKVSIKVILVISRLSLTLIPSAFHWRIVTLFCQMKDGCILRKTMMLMILLVGLTLNDVTYCSLGRVTVGTKTMTLMILLVE